MIAISDESDEKGARFQLLIDGGPRALLTQDYYGTVSVTWQIYGPQYWPDAKLVVQGLLELSVIADQLHGVKHE